MSLFFVNTYPCGAWVLPACYIETGTFWHQEAGENPQSPQAFLQPYKNFSVCGSGYSHTVFKIQRIQYIICCVLWRGFRTGRSCGNDTCFQEKGAYGTLYNLLPGRPYQQPGRENQPFQNTNRKWLYRLFFLYEGMQVWSFDKKQYQEAQARIDLHTLR